MLTHLNSTEVAKATCEGKAYYPQAMARKIRDSLIELQVNIHLRCDSIPFWPSVQFQDFGIAYKFANECAYAVKVIPESSDYFQATQDLLQALLSLTMKKTDVNNGFASIQLAEGSIIDDLVKQRVERTGSLIKGWAGNHFYDITDEAAFCRYTNVFKYTL